MAAVVVTSDDTPTTASPSPPGDDAAPTSDGCGSTTGTTVATTTAAMRTTGTTTTTNGTYMPLQLLPGPCYAVKRGRLDVTGCVFVTWSHAHPFVHGLADAVYRPFDDPRDAARWLLLPEDDGDDGGGVDGDGDGGKAVGGGCVNVDADDERGVDALLRKRLEAEAAGGADSVGTGGGCTGVEADADAGGPDGDDGAVTPSSASAGATPASASAPGPDTSAAAVSASGGGGGTGTATASAVAGSTPAAAAAVTVAPTYYHPQAATAAPHYYHYCGAAVAAAAPAPASASAALTAAATVLARCPPTAAAGDGVCAVACATTMTGAGKRGRDDEGNSPEVGDGKKRRRVITGRWNRMFQRLVRHRERHGTCHVVASSAGTLEANSGGDGDDKDGDAEAVPGRNGDDRVDGELCRWVRTQRNEYKKLKEGSESNKRKTKAMFDEKIDRLRSIGFDFGHYTVEERLEQLRRYRKVMCDPNAVPSIDHPMLGTFVRRYHKDRSLRKQGKETKHFTEEELDRLDESLGLFSESSMAGTATTGGGRGGGNGENDDGNVVVPPDCTAARRRRPTKSWNNMFERLSQHRARHGTCEVPSGTTASAADKALCKWIRDQRTAYKRMLDGKPSQMYDEKVRRLRSVGFDMGHYAFAERLEQLRHYREGHPDDGSVVPPVDHPLLGKFARRVLEDLRRIDDGKEPRHHTARQIDLLRSSPGGFDAAKVQTSSSALRYHEPSEEEEREWDDMLNEWLRHREGHVAATANEWDNSGGVVPPVPRGTPLAKWVQVQRMEYRKVRRGTTTGEVVSGGGGGDGRKRAPWSSGPCRMTPRRLARLNDAGFDFGPRSGKYLSWDERLGQLRGYVEEHGHCRVPISHPVLGEWVEKTRTKYHRYVRGDDKPGITEERIRQLTELGFVFRAGKPPAQPVSCLPFEDRFGQLLEFRRVHGTTVVPQHYADVPGLGRWVKQQRNDYQTMVKGGKSSMTPQKALRLVEAGFVFDAKNRRGKRWTSGDG